MADPLSITASIITVLQLAGSVVSLGLSLRDAAKTDGGVLQELLDELEGLTSILEPLAQLAEGHSQEARSIEALGKPGGALDGCRLVLEKLKIELDSVVSAQGVKKLGKILLWPTKEKEVQSLLRQLSERKSTLGLALHNVQVELSHGLGVKIGTVGDILVSSHISMMSRFVQDYYNRNHLINCIGSKRNKALRWLNVGDASASQAEACKKRQSGTGVWFLNRPEYAAWKTERSSLLWLRGKAGCGKSILSSTIIDDLIAYSSVLPGIAVGYFYFDFSDMHRLSVKSLLSSLLGQLSSHLPKLPSCVESLYDRYEENGHQPMERELKAALIFVIELFSDVYVLLDALDECTERDELMELLDEVLGRRIESLHLLTTSRREREIEEGFYNHQPIGIDLEEQMDEDIILRIRGRLSKDLRLKRLAQPIKVEIEAALLDGAQGMFLWVDRQLDALRHCSRPAAIRRALKSLPQDLEETYNRILVRIQGDEDCFRDAFAVLQWLAAAVRPPTLSEVAEAIAISPGCVTIDEENRLFDAHELLFICSGLVMLVGDNETGRLRLTHFSVKEYLVSPRIRSSPASAFALEEVQAHKYVASICLTYLLTFKEADVFLAPQCDGDDTQREPNTDKPLVDGEAPTQYSSRRSMTPKVIYKTFPLLRYAARYWSKHVRALPLEEAMELNQQVLDLMNPLRDACFLNWLRASNPHMIGEYGFEAGIVDLRPPLYYAALLGLSTVVRSMLDNGADVHGLSMYAEDDSVSIYFENVPGLGAERRYDSSRRGGLWRNPWRSPLHDAIYRGHQEVVKILLSSGASAHDLDEYDRTTLHIACLKSRYEIVEFLLEEGADINRSIDPSLTMSIPALQAAAYEGDEKLIRLLLERGAEVNAEDPSGNTALQEACRLGHYRIVELLIESGASINARGGFYGSALQAAAGMRREAIARLLVTHGAEFTATEGYAGSALVNAAMSGLEATVKLLLDLGADVNAKGRLGSALGAACRRSDSSAIVDLLLAHGADVKQDGGPLNGATDRDDRPLITRLLDLGADINACCFDHGPPLQVAAFNSDESLVGLFLTRGAALNMDPRGRLGFPLQAAALCGNIATAQMLLDAGADVNAVGGKFGTALIAAAFAGYQKTAQLLLDSGADVNASGGKYGTALIAAAFYGHEGMARLLLENGADAMSKSESIGNALAAATKGHKGPHETVLELLRQHGVTEIWMPERVSEEDAEEEFDTDVDISMIGEGDYRDEESVALSGELNEELANSYD